MSKKASSKKSAASSASADVNDEDLPSIAPHLNADKSLPYLPPLLCLPPEILAHLLCYLSARCLGATLISSKTLLVNFGPYRYQVLLSRFPLYMPSPPSDPVAYAKGVLDLALSSGVQLSRKAKGKKDFKGLGLEFPSYARFLEEAVQGTSLLRVLPLLRPGSKEHAAAKKTGGIPLPPHVNGRFASLSPSHTVLRVGGSGPTCGGGSGALTFGCGMRGALGRGKREDDNSPSRVPYGVGHSLRVVQVSAGGSLVRMGHTLLLTDVGRVLSFGCAKYGQLGHGYGPGKTLPDETRPKFVDALKGEFVTCVSAGELHSAAVTSDGDVYTWGDAFCGQLGLGDKRPQLLPKKVGHDLEYECSVSVSCGSRVTLVVTDEGELFSFGLGFYGALGREFTPFEYGEQNGGAAADEAGADEDAPPIIGGGDAGDAAVENPPPPPQQQQPGGAWVMPEEMEKALDLLGKLTLDDGSTQCLPVKIEALDHVKIKGVSAGHRHCLALDEDGNVYSWGSGLGGALGHGNNLKVEIPERIEELHQLGKKIVNCSAGVDTSMCVTDGGGCYAWGATKGGRIGLASLGEREVSIPRQVQLGEGVKCVAVEASYVHSVIVLLTGQFMMCGGVGLGGNDDGAAELGEGALPKVIENEECNAWQRNVEAKEVKVVQEYKKYGKYETKGRSAMMAEAAKWENKPKDA